MSKKRGNNEGSIVKRKDGLWMAQVTIGRDPETGKPKRAYFYGKTRAEAADQLTKALSDLSRGSFVAPQKVTLSQWLDIWLQEYKQSAVRPRTYDSYEFLIHTYINPTLGHVPLKDLRPEQLQHLYNEKLKGGLSARTVRLTHTVLHGALEQAVRNNLVVRNVTDVASPPKVVKREIQPMTEGQVAQLLAAIRGDRLFPAIYLGLATGVRCGELLALR